jgi:hypothetical protein
MVFTKVFILPQIPTCGGYNCRCQFQFELSNYKHLEIWVGIPKVILSFFGNLWNAEPHKHTMSRGCSSSINFLQRPNIFIQWWESDWVPISDVHSKYCMWKLVFRWRPCFIGHSTYYFFYISSHERRLQVFHECLDVVLKPLKEANFKGLSLTNPHSDEHWVFLLLYAYVCDQPKGCKVCCLSSFYTCKYIQILSLWKLKLEMNLGFSFFHLNDLWLICCLWINMYLWHKSMSTSMQLVHVSKAILKGGGKKNWLPK